LAFSVSRSLKNSGFRIVEPTTLSDLVSNNERSNYSSNSRYSRYSKTTGHERDLNRGITELSWRRIFRMRLGFSYIGGGPGSRFSLVRLLEASVLLFPRNQINITNLFSLSNYKLIIQKLRIIKCTGAICKLDMPFIRLDRRLTEADFIYFH